MTARTPVTRSSDDYAPFDQRKHLGEPPWSDPELETWEEAHGHDARVKCYPEHGCLAIGYENERLRDENAHLRSLLWSFVASAVLSTHLDTTVLGVNTNTWHEAADLIGYDEMGQ